MFVKNKFEIFIYRFLAQGDSMFGIAASYHIGTSTLAVICEVVMPKVLPQLTEADYKRIAEQYERKWQMPNCIGLVDGKHIQIQVPSKSGSLYFNYNKYFSIVLFAVCDANYNLLIVDVGAYGSQSDGVILASSNFGIALANNLLPIPQATELPNSPIKSEYFFIGDEAFPLHKHLMRPYSKASLTLNHLPSVSQTP